MRSNFYMADEYITMTRGDTLAFGLECLDLEGDPVELASAYFSCKSNLNETEYVFQKSLGDGITQVESGKYAVRVAPSDTANLDAGKYFYDLQLGLNGDIYTLLRGILEIDATATREV